MSPQQEQGVEVDPNFVIASLQGQIAQKAREVAERDAMIAQLHNELQATRGQIDEMAGAIASKETK